MEARELRLKVEVTRRWKDCNSLDGLGEDPEPEGEVDLAPRVVSGELGRGAGELERDEGIYHQ